MAVVPGCAGLVREWQLGNTIDELGIGFSRIAQLCLRVELLHGGVAEEAIGQP